MNICIQGVAPCATPFDVKRAIAKVLHGNDFARIYLPHQTRPVNFLVILDSDNVPNSIRNKGSGVLTLPDRKLGLNFLAFLRDLKVKIKVLKKVIYFSRLETVPNGKALYTLQKVPYQDPTIVEERLDILKELAPQTCIRTLQFGVFYRTPPRLVFSPEWQEDFQHHGDARLTFQYEHKLLRVRIGDHSDVESRSIVLKFSNLKRIFIGWDAGNPFILFHLTTPPPLEVESMYRPDTGRPWEDNRHVRHRVGFFDEAHRSIAPYVHQLRLVLKQGSDLDQFAHMCVKAEIQPPIRVSNSVEVLRLNIFSPANLHKIGSWLSKLEWAVAFQAEALLRNLRLNAIELLALKPDIDALARRDPKNAAQILRHFHTVLRSLLPGESATEGFTRAIKEFEQQLVDKRRHFGSGYFDTHHVSFTPTAMRLEGPYAHQSNRVLREYVDYQEYFIRVDFRDEDRLQLRWDREVDGASFVRERVGQILLHGFTIAGRKFEFLGYSQSQLRGHSVFAVAPFMHTEKGRVTASTIRDEQGIFDDVICYPALYAARLSQAFSGTEVSVYLRADQWDEMDDVKHRDKNHERCFTDGVGTISPDLAKQIWSTLCEQRQQNPLTPFTPCAFQIRFRGYKGMVAVDTQLTGIMMRLRPSMRKFEVQGKDPMPLEIARAFEYPGPMYLNRPLIQILEDLGVQKEAFLALQEAAVADVRTSRNSLLEFAKLLDSHALGRSFSLSYILGSLDKIGCDIGHHDPSRAAGTPFLQGVIDTAMLSVLRDLKHSARIPVPNGWTLVGIADEYSILGPDEIYACVWERDMKEPMWLEGWAMISRSPSIHTGDVQMVRAIGKPPASSPLEREPLPNCVVFSCKGERDIPSCLGGGDLDGDLYTVWQNRDLLVNPSQLHPPGDYPPTKRKDIGRPSKIEDVAEFVVEFINSDMVGLLSTNHLILSDQSSFGTCDYGCVELAKLCSIAVDYPKSGIPVKMDTVPRFLIKEKPDWRQDEVLNPRRTDYYESSRAIGHLFRAINLEASTRELSYDCKTAKLMDKPTPSVELVQVTDGVSSTLGAILEPYLSSLNDSTEKKIHTLFRKYAQELKYMCITHTLSHDPDVRLREEEIVVGTILAKCAQARWRKDRIEQMRINATRLVSIVSAELWGPETACATEKIRTGWAAWKYSRNCREFGHWSFGLVALKVVFRALDELENASAAKQADGYKGDVEEYF